MKMGTAHKQNISVQHRIWNQNEKLYVMSCEEWRDHRFTQMKQAGARIGYNKEYDLYRISWQGKEPIIVSHAEIKADWKRCYLHRRIEA